MRPFECVRLNIALIIRLVWIPTGLRRLLLEMETKTMGELKFNLINSLPDGFVKPRPGNDINMFDKRAFWFKGIE